ncbi:hypothetical protein B7R54_11650 [Subtercola boreus]|uniref:DUF7882 domain-containing protein n=1 Tax=Subtercola boreus TaxID=120213 RepID=A0A3E0VJH4_9MICO|nr:hypothetical protein [Subtercola boreus]RFA09785.1 hypothetical protein B7R54_11650 [Subtercola boreus]TQL53099.1 hypothetical protein FB464_0592 [Subtercola boreus]
MGTLTYGSSGTVLQFDDRLLAHLQAVIMAKLRRDEKFGLTCSHDAGGYTSVWLHPSIPLVFTFDTVDRPQLNRPWVELLMQSANSGSGLSMIPEPRD